MPVREFPTQLCQGPVSIRSRSLDTRLEQRLSPRRNTMIEATIAFDGGRTRVACIIRNLSETGAKLEVVSGTVSTIPRTFDLVVAGAGLTSRRRRAARRRR